MGEKEFKFNTVEEAIEDIRKGKMVIVVDDPIGRTRATS